MGRRRAVQDVVTGTALWLAAGVLAAGCNESNDATLIAPGAPRLAFVDQPPTTTTAGSTLPTLEVVVLGADGVTPDASAAGAVTVRLADGAGGALAGTTTQTPSGGIARFAGLRVTRAGQAYTLRATYAGAAEAVSQTFDVAPGGPSTLSFLVEPSSAQTGQALTPAVEVELLDEHGNRATSATRTVTIGLDANPGGAALSGTLTAPASDGVARFADLVLDRPGSGYTLTASAAGLPAATSQRFGVTVPSGGTPPASPPAAPVSLTATPGGPTQVDLGWTDAATDETGFRVERSPTGSNTWTQLGTVGANVTAFSDTMAAPATAYDYRVFAANANGSSPPSNVATAATPPTPPLAATGLSANVASAVQVDLGWTDNAVNEAGFRVERSPLGQGAWSLVGVAPADATSYSDTTTTSDRAYDYRVVATNAGGNAGSSNVASATTPPVAPQGLGVTLNGAQAQLAWTDASSTETGFRVERSPQGQGAWSLVTTMTTGSTAAIDPTPAADTAYDYRVLATNAGGTSPASNVAVLVTPPHAPTGVTASVLGVSRVDLTWTDVSATESGFRVERTTRGGTTWTGVGVTAPGATSLTDTSTSVDTAYDYRVLSTNAGGAAPSSVVSVTTPPVPPTGLTAQAVGPTLVTLTWTDASSTEDGFRVERRPGGGAAWSPVGTVPAGQITFDDGTVTAGTAYEYQVVAFNAGGESAPTPQVSSTTPISPPTAPTGLGAATAGSSRIDLTWADTSTDETGFRLERRAAGGGAWTTIASLPAGSTSLQDATVATDTTYDYRVFAINDGGDSAASNVVAASTPPLPAAALVAVTNGATRVGLSWTDVSATETGFRVERSPVGAGTWTSLGVLPAGSTSFSDGGAPADASSDYRVIAVGPGGDAAASNVVTATTPPVAPSGLAAVATGPTQVGLTWIDASASEQGFRVQRSPSGQDAWTTVATLAAGSTGWSDPSAPGDATLDYRVLAFNPGGDSAPSDVVGVVTPPNAPGSLIAAVGGSARVDLSWSDMSSTETSFEIERRPQGAGTFTQVGTVGAGVTTYSDTAAPTDAAVEYRVVAVNAGGASPSSNVAEATLPPHSPASLAASVTGPMRVDLTWTDAAATETAFRVERSPQAQASWTTVALLPAATSAWSDDSAPADAAVDYRVIALNAGGDSKPSNVVSAVTAPVAPTNVTASAGGAARIDVSWTDASRTETGFRVDRSPAGANTFAAVGATGPGLTTFADLTAPADATFDYRVVAVNGGGEAPATPVTASTPPTPATDLTASVAPDGRVVLNWTDTSSTETSFRLERRIGAAGPWIVTGSAPAGAATFTDGAVALDQVYEYRMYAVGPGGDSTPSGTTAATTRPLAPTGVIVSAAGTNVDVTWTDASSTETGFRVERSPAGAGAWTTAGSVPGGATAFTDVTAPDDAALDYRVVATNASGDSPPSGVAQASTRPGAPVNLVATAAGPQRIDLTWTDASATEAQFLVQRSPSAQGTWSTIATLAAGVTSTSDQAAPEDASLDYRVIAVNSAGSTPGTPVTVPTPPSPALAPVATAVAPTQVDVTWTDGSTREAGFRLERSPAGQNVWSPVGSVSADVTTFSDTTAIGLTSYDYRVVAFNAAGDGRPSPLTTATTPDTPPAAPSGLTAAAIGASRVDLAWIDGSTNETGFRVERSPAGAATWSSVGAVGADVATFVDSTVQADRAYDYRVVATGSGGDSSASNVAIATTAPVAAAGVVVSASASGQLDVAWTDTSTFETNFRVDRRLLGVGSFVGVGTVGAGVTAFTDSTVTGDSAYEYRVVAFSAAGEAPPSGVAVGRTAPAAPTDVTATTVSASQVDIAWSDASATEAAFDVERSPAGVGAWTVVGSTAANATSFSDTTTSVDHAYDYRVVARSTGGASPSATVAAVTPPSAPTGLGGAAASDTRIDLTWTDTSQTETAFRVERRPLGGAGWTTLTGALPAGSTGYSDPTVAATTGYEYRVFATNTGGSSAASNVLAITTPAAAPVAPTNVTATPVAATQVNVAWTDASTTETSFRIERSPRGAGAWVQVGARGADATTFSDTSALPDREYDYRVFAANGGGDSAPSNVAPATTVPVAAGGLIAHEVSTTQVQLGWTDASQTETGFRIERSAPDAALFSTAGSVGAGVTAFTDTPPGAGPWDYRVVAFNATGDAPGSSVVRSSAQPPRVADLTAMVRRGCVHLEYRLTQAQSRRADVLVEVSQDGVTWSRATQAGADPAPDVSGVYALRTSPTGEPHAFLWDSARDLGGVTRTVHARISATPTEGGDTGTPAAVSFTLENGPLLVSGTPVSTGAAGSAPSAVASGDLDRDGDTDLVVANAGPGNATVLLGDGAGNFTAGTVIGTGSQPRAIAVADLDRDGRPDLCVLSVGELRVILGNGDGTFNAASLTTYSAGGAPRDLTPADLDRDGDLDLVAVDQTGVQIFRSAGNGTFVAETPFGAGAQPRACAVHDLDRDGRPDLAIADSAAALHVLLGQAGGGYVAATESPVTLGITPFDVIAADLDRDGKPDLALADTNADAVLVLRGDGDGTFQAPTSTAVGSLPFALAAADLDQDAVPDLAILHQNGALTLLDGVGDGGLRSATVLGAGTGPAALLLTDLDRDGLPDAAVVDGAGSTVIPLLDGGSTRCGFDLAAEQRIRPGASDPEWSAVGDMNDDGKNDVVVVRPGFVDVLPGRGDMTLAAPISKAIGTPRDVALADVDRDGILDAVVVDQASGLRIYLGAGDGTLNDPFTAGVGPTPSAVALADLNGDGRTDFVVTVQGNSTLATCLGNGDGTFQAPTGPLVVGTGGNPLGVALGDIDRDGDLDAAVTAFDPDTLIVHYGLGGGLFSPATSLPLGQHGPVDVGLVDFTGDGLLDALVTCVEAHLVVLRRGNGDGTFGSPAPFRVGPPAPAPLTGAPYGLAIGDMDRDGRPDVVTANTNHASASVLRSNGAGFDPARLHGAGQQPRSVALGDLDGDGLLDVVVPSLGGRGEFSVLRGRGDGRLEEIPGDATGGGARSVLTLDLDRDGDQDPVASDSSQNQLWLYENAGDGGLGASPFRVGVGAGPSDLEAADLDGDGIGDVVVLNYDASSVSILTGDGAGSLAPLSTKGATWAGIALGDVDGDGDPDLAGASNVGDSFQVLLNDGTGRFTVQSASLSTGTESTDVILVDVNGDGRLDAVVANHASNSNSISVALGRGDGTFSGPVNYTVGPTPIQLAAGDLDRDGDPDVVVVNDSVGRVSVLRNDGAGVFAWTSAYSTGGAVPRRAVLRDVDEDGVLDVLVTNTSNSEVAFLRGNGDLTLAPARRWGAGLAPVTPFSFATVDLFVVDLDRDGRADLLVAQQSSSQLRRLFAR